MAVERVLRYASVGDVSLLPRLSGVARTVTDDMISDFGQRLAYRRVGIEQGVVLLRIPLGQCRQLLRDSREKSNDDADRGRLHFATKFGDSSFVLQGAH